jgi:polar amino acid transport system substrate-binding protein
MAATGAATSKGLIAVVLIVGIVVGFSVGFLTPALLPQPPETPPVNWVQVIQQRGKLIVGTDAPWPPFEFYNTTTSRFEGFDIDLSALIADYLNVTLEIQDIDFDLLIGACQAESVDMIAAAMFVTPDRAEELAHSVPYIRTNEVVVVKSGSSLAITNLTQLAGHGVGVQTGTVEDEELTYWDDHGFDIDITRYPKADVMMAALEAGTEEAVYIDEPVFTVYSKVYALKTIYTVPAPPTALFCRWETPELMTAINTVILNGFTDGSLDTLIAKWFG